MLIRLFDTSDYDRSLRRRRLLALSLLAVGITGVVCYFLLVYNSEALSDHARGFYLGAATGICLGALVLIGFLYGAPVTRPLVDHFHALKLRLLGL